MRKLTSLLGFPVEAFFIAHSEASRKGANALNMENVFRNWYERIMNDPQRIDETRQAQGVLKSVRSVAIVGISKDVHKDSHYVGRYLQHAGYRIFPVNPSASSILGQPAYAALSDIPERVDAVSVFRKTSDLPEVVRQALPLQPKAIWIQLGIEPHDDAVELARNAGIVVFTHRCIKVDHQFLIRNPYSPNRRTYV